MCFNIIALGKKIKEKKQGSQHFTTVRNEGWKRLITDILSCLCTTRICSIIILGAFAISFCVYPFSMENRGGGWCKFFFGDTSEAH